jgi:acyl-CoA synthetase (AMP-forming)/AMP-acid ligase II
MRQARRDRASGERNARSIIPKTIRNQPPPYTPDKVLTYKIRFVPIEHDYLWTFKMNQSPFAVSTSTTAVQQITDTVRLAKYRMTLIFDPDEDLSSNFISARWDTSGTIQQGVRVTEKQAYASQNQPGVIEETLSASDPRGYFYTVGTTQAPSLVMQTRRNCFIDLTFQIILTDGACVGGTSVGLTANWFYTNCWSTNLTCPGRISATWI